MNCGRITSGHPSLGSWVNYGTVVPMRISRATWSCWMKPAAPSVGRRTGQVVTCLPIRGPASLGRATHSGLGSAGAFAGPASAGSARPPSDRKSLARSEPLRQSRLNARINQFELAYRMQSEAPEATDLSQERQSVLDLYGIEAEPTLLVENA